eukprot:Nitzschia sp. Nitz4//scaffold135_size62275//24719//25861//NITZ4_006349-RA/size62275-processed-gene-0.31-mRNA-1//-1//CDS//3329535560//5821//frame0
MWTRISCLLLSIATLAHARLLADVKTDMVRILPFDVSLALTGDPTAVNAYSLKNIVQDWMSDSFQTRVASQNLLDTNTTFDSLLLELTSRRRLQEISELADGVYLYSVQFEGISLWERPATSETPVDADIVELLQYATFLQDEQLLALLRTAEEGSGLGTNVFDVRVAVSSEDDDSGSDDSSNKSLEIIIIVAIVVACLAFGLLMFAVVWAWRTDQSNRESYKPEPPKPAITREIPKADESDYDIPPPPRKAKTQAALAPPVAEPEPAPTPALPPSEVSPSPNHYPDSVISEDISTSLTAYYRSGVAGYSTNGSRAGGPQPIPKGFDDGASMSSMDSYGYSLDGYAPSLGPAPQGYPVGGSLAGVVKDSDGENTDEDETK